MKRILFCTQTPLTKTLGAPKVIMELAEAMEAAGWDCELRGRFDLDMAASQTPTDDYTYSRHLRHFLHQRSGDYDVIDYDHGHLPYPRTEFAPQTLLVARSVLLTHHFDKIVIPHGRSWKSRARHLLCAPWDQHKQAKRTRRAQRTLQEADLVNVPCEQDQAALAGRGIDAGKIAVIPYGISQERRPVFEAVPSVPPHTPTVAFVGTFDYRKGAREFPALVQRITASVPEVRFRLLGTAGMFRTKAQVLAHFPAALRHKIEVVPRFAPEALPSLLAACTVGIFPSYVEGFGFGVLEMLAASVPVIAYDAPGPPMMLPAEFLVPRGDAAAMAAKAVFFLTHPAELWATRVWAQERSQEFSWERAARTTSDLYLQRLEIKRQESREAI